MMNDGTVTRGVRSVATAARRYASSASRSRCRSSVATFARSPPATSGRCSSRRTAPCSRAARVARPPAGRSDIGNVYMPQPVTGLGAGQRRIDIAAGFEGGLALKADGTCGNGATTTTGSSACSATRRRIGPCSDAGAAAARTAGRRHRDGQRLPRARAARRRQRARLGLRLLRPGRQRRRPDGLVVMTPTVISMPGRARSASPLGLELARADPAGRRPGLGAARHVGRRLGRRRDRRRGRAAASSRSACRRRCHTTSPSDWSRGRDGRRRRRHARRRHGDRARRRHERRGRRSGARRRARRGRRDVHGRARDMSHGIRLDRSQATATIDDDDEPPAVSVAPATSTRATRA